MTGRLCAILSILFLALGYIRAQEPKRDTTAVKLGRPIFSSVSFSTGRANMHDDYLSLNNYRGWELGLLYEHMRVASYGEGRWVLRHRLDVDAAKGLNMSRNGEMIAASVAYTHGQLYTWKFPCGINIRSGAEIALSGGALYCPGNSNNPATAKLNIAIGLSEMISYTWHINRLPITFRYHMSLPVIGAFFSPAFGESYYEMFYPGNTRGIFNCGAWHNRFDMGNLITIDIPLGRHALRIGYDNRIRTSRADHTRYFHYSNAFLIGLSTPIGRTASRPNTLSPFY
ncbi:MAG: DUF3316 domain-containing protein [Coprobacter sp.]|nr:DUF3316 domain-containing protein [Coprobacter sp.]